MEKNEGDDLHEVKYQLGRKSQLGYLIEPISEKLQIQN